MLLLKSNISDSNIMTYIQLTIQLMYIHVLSSVLYIDKGD
jgi:hypothetical protein